MLDRHLNGLDKPVRADTKCSFFGLFSGNSSNTTVQTNQQNVNVDVSVNPNIIFGDQVLKPVEAGLTSLNNTILEQFRPLTLELEKSVENSNRLAADIRSVAPGPGQSRPPTASGGMTLQSFILPVLAGLTVAFLVPKLMR